MRLVLISIATAALLSLVLLSIRFWGLSQTADDFDHPWFHIQTPWMIVPFETADPESRSVLEKKQALPNAMIWIYVYDSLERNLFATSTVIAPSLQPHTDAELSQLGRPLRDVLGRFQGKNLILDIRSNEDSIDLQISDLIGKSGNGRIMIQSDYDVILRSIKKLQPLWLYGSSQAERVRFTTFDSLLIVTATTFKGDVYLGPFKQKGILLLTESIFKELKRRGKKVIIGPLESKDELEQALRLGADGIVMEKPVLLNL